MEINPTDLAKANVSAASALIGDPSKFGRVGEDGTVYVITPNGEKAVGSYPGKSNEEALQYFVRKFEAVASEVALLAARIKSGAMVPSDALEAVTKLREQVANLNGVGDLATLSTSVDQLPALISQHEGAYNERKAVEAAVREAKKAATLIEKQKIVEAAETLIDSTSWKVSSEKLKELMDAWKAAARLDKESDTELWKRFSAARNKFDKRRRAHFANLDTAHKEVAAKKEELVRQAQALVNSKEWLPTANKFKDLMSAWKAAGRGKSSADTKLWAQFKEAQDSFFAAKNADMEKRGVTMEANLAKREELIPKFEAILPISDVQKARKEFRALMEQWSKIGMTDRKKRAELDARIDKVESAIKELVEEHNRRTDPTAIARANDVVKGLVDAIASYEEQAVKAEAAGNSAKAMVAREAAAARRAWLEEAQKGLADFKQN
ncbi:MAG: hypothetical protein RL129_50 [Actinomycetota bacterium]|jgi:hypothetical protein